MQGNKGISACLVHQRTVESSTRSLRSPSTIFQNTQPLAYNSKPESQAFLEGMYYQVKSIVHMCCGPTRFLSGLDFARRLRRWLRCKLRVAHVVLLRRSISLVLGGLTRPVQRGSQGRSACPWLDYSRLPDHSPLSTPAAGKSTGDGNPMKTLLVANARRE